MEHIILIWGTVARHNNKFLNIQVPKSTFKYQNVPKSTLPLQKYLHESRHLHACRRVRGEGGRFQSKGSNNNGQASPEIKTEVGAYNFVILFVLI